MNHKMPEGKRLTHYSPQDNLKAGTLELGFSYKREDLRVLNSNEVKRFFSPLESTYQQIFLLNSAQVGITILLNYFKNHLKINSICMDSRPYVGTLEALNFIEIDYNSESSSIYWIDSSNSKRELLDERLKKSWEIVVIDSTCWSLDDDTFKYVLSKVKTNELFIVRSISKLDMGGVEYGSFGSLIYQKFNETKFIKVFEKMYKIYGCAPSLCDISPDLTNEDFYQNNLERCQRIVQNTNLLKQHLQNLPKQMKVDFLEHRKYFTILLPEDINNFESLKLKKFHTLLKYYNVNFKCVRSFGFNFWNLDFYKIEATSRFNLRVCTSPDANEQEVSKFAEALITYLAAL